MTYRAKDQHYRKLRRAKFLWRGFFALVVLFVGVIGWLVADYILHADQRNQTTVSVEGSKVQGLDVSAFRTDYYYFQASTEWRELVDDGLEDGYTYIKSDGDLITQRLQVYVNRSGLEKDQDLKITNVLPLDVEADHFANFGSVSEHCDKGWTNALNRDPARINFEKVSFVCAPTSQQYNVIFGERGGDENITVQKSSGETAEITIIYSDLTAYPSSGDIYNIAKRFQILNQ